MRRTRTCFASYHRCTSLCIPRSHKHTSLLLCLSASAPDLSPLPVPAPGKDRTRPNRSWTAARTLRAAGSSTRMTRSPDRKWGWDAKGKGTQKTQQEGDGAEETGKGSHIHQRPQSHNLRKSNRGGGGVLPAFLRACRIASHLLFLTGNRDGVPGDGRGRAGVRLVLLSVWRLAVGEPFVTGETEAATKTGRTCDKNRSPDVRSCLTRFPAGNCFSANATPGFGCLKCCRYLRAQSSSINNLGCRYVPELVEAP